MKVQLPTRAQFQRTGFCLLADSESEEETKQREKKEEDATLMVQLAVEIAWIHSRSKHGYSEDSKAIF